MGKELRKTAAAYALMAVLPACASGYFNNFDWSRTATDGPVSEGEAITLTWGIANDGTTVPNVLPGVSRSSDLVASLDGWYGSGDGGADLTTRPWFDYLAYSFEAWDAVSGLTFLYEGNDDGAIHGPSPGALGARADVRLAGGRIDGTVGTNVGTLAYSIAPNNADIFFDTDDVAYYSNPAGDAFGLRHTLMHEIGHSLGLGHVTSNSANILLEPFPQTSFDGPQLDDIRGAHWLFGDADEEFGVGYVRDLGALQAGDAVVVGADGGAIDFTPGMVDLVSIHRSSDTDSYALSVTEPVRLDVTVTPVGATYDQRIGGGASTNILASRVGNLALQVNRNGGLFDASTSGGFGDSESISRVVTPGDDFILSVSGLVGATQLYRLDVTATALALEGDFNGDGLVNAADYTLWRDGGPADGNADGIVDRQDYAIWASAYGATATAVAVPEPGPWLLTLGLICCCFVAKVPGRCL